MCDLATPIRLSLHVVKQIERGRGGGKETGPDRQRRRA